MAEVGGKCESKNDTENVHAHVSIHQQMTDAGQFSYAALCALSLRKLFEEDWNRHFNKEILSLILNHLEQSKQVQEAIHAMYGGAGQDDMHPYVDVILSEKVLQEDASPVISELISFAVSQGHYDARMRTLIKHMAWRLHIGWDHMEEIECQLAETIISQKYEQSEEEKAEQEKKAKHRKFKRAALIGLATVTGGTLIGLTGGLAAPLVAAGAGAIIGGAGAAALGSAAGVAIIGSLFGVAGAGLTGYKMKKRVGAIEEFEFEPLISGGPLQLQTVRQQLHITIAITGWIDSKMPDFKQPWQNLAESQEQYCLRWESRYLKDLGQALDYIFNSAVSIATHEALKYTVLSTLMAAITWPAALLSVSQVIDNPWSVALQRAVAAGRQLAEVLLSREQGKRPVTLIGYSLGGRVIFYCLEEMAKRRGCEGIVEDVVMLGAPVTSNPKAWAPLQRVVAGRIINGYCRGDWLLKFLYRTASIQFRIAGLAPVKWTNHRMHNIDLSDVVSGHLDYMEQLDTILKVVGIRVRQDVRVTKGPASKASVFPIATTSQGSSPTDSSSGVVASDSDSSVEKLNTVDQQTCHANTTSSVNSESQSVPDVGLPSSTESQSVPDVGLPSSTESQSVPDVGLPSSAERTDKPNSVKQEQEIDMKEGQAHPGFHKSSPETSQSMAVSVKPEEESDGKVDQASPDSQKSSQEQVAQSMNKNPEDCVKPEEESDGKVDQASPDCQKSSQEQVAQSINKNPEDCVKPEEESDGKVDQASPDCQKSSQGQFAQSIDENPKDCVKPEEETDGKVDQASPDCQKSSQGQLAQPMDKNPEDCFNQEPDLPPTKTETSNYNQNRSKQNEDPDLKAWSEDAAEMEKTHESTDQLGAGTVDSAAESTEGAAEIDGTTPAGVEKVVLV